MARTRRAKMAAFAAARERIQDANERARKRTDSAHDRDKGRAL